MASAPGKLEIREVVRESRWAIWDHCSTLVGPVLAITAVQFVVAWSTEWMEASWRPLAFAIPLASLAVAWHRTLLFGQPMTLATLRRWTPAHWVFVGVAVAWQLPGLVTVGAVHAGTFDAWTLVIAQ